MKFFLNFSFIILSLTVVGIHCGSNAFHDCKLPPDTGYPCSTAPGGPLPVGPISPNGIYYFHNVTSGFCDELEYNGCGGNSNLFTDLTYCETFCSGQGNARPSVTASPSIDVTLE